MDTIRIHSLDYDTKMNFEEAIIPNVLVQLHYKSFIPIRNILISVIIALIVYHLKNRFCYLSRLPPGPWGLPIVGYLPWMLDSPHTRYQQMSERYGDVTSVTLGRNLVVCLGSAKMICELFGRQDSIGRPNTPLNNLLGGRGIILSEGAIWKQHRMFLSQKLRCLGVKYCDKQAFEQYILLEIEEFHNSLDTLKGAAVDPASILGRHIHNVICQLLMSFRFKKGDEDFDKFNERIAEGMRLYGSIHIGEHLPFYLRLPGKKVALKAIGRNLEEFCQFHSRHLYKRQQERSMNGLTVHPPADLLDCYLDAIDNNNSEDTTKIFSKSESEEEPVKQTVQVMNDLFSAGMETSRTAVAWSLVMMLREPSVAAKVRRDLASVLAPGELLTMEHRHRLPYVEAVINETLRRVTVVPLGTTHTNMTEWEIGKFRIPAGTHLVPLIGKIHMDPESFPEPDRFLPERFLRDGKLQNLENFMPFGTGRRVCLGEQLARLELFLFFGNLMNSFDFELADGEDMPGLEGVLGTTHAPLPFKVIFKKLK